MNGQDKTPVKQLNEVEIGNHPEKESRIMIVKMIQILGKTMEKIQEMFTKEPRRTKEQTRDEHCTRWNNLVFSLFYETCPDLYI